MTSAEFWQEHSRRVAADWDRWERGEQFARANSEGEEMANAEGILEGSNSRAGMGGGEAEVVAREIQSVTLSRKQFCDLVSYVARLRKELEEAREAGRRRLEIIGALTIDLESEKEKVQKLEAPQPQRQDSLCDQLADLERVATRLGMYDAADFLRRYAVVE